MSDPLVFPTARGRLHVELVEHFGLTFTHPQNGVSDHIDDLQTLRRLGAQLQAYALEHTCMASMGGVHCQLHAHTEGDHMGTSMELFGTSERQLVEVRWGPAGAKWRPVVEPVVLRVLDCPQCRSEECTCP